jgi:hypothetical protein
VALLCKTTAAIVLGSSVFLATAPASAQEPANESSESRVELTPDLSTLPKAPLNWKGVMTGSLNLLSIQHATRVAFQDWTRDELGGPFFSDWSRSLRMPHTWGDGDHWSVNYLGHAVQGAASGFIWLDNEDGPHDPTLGFSKAYWGSRGRATAWAAAYSVQFEFGPLSEASIGNVGWRPEKTGWVDHVVTPVGALAFMVVEDALDRYVITRIESRTRNTFLRALARITLNPSRALSTAAQGRMPWDRALRPLER